MAVELERKLHETTIPGQDSNFWFDKDVYLKTATKIENDFLITVQMKIIYFRKTSVMIEQLNSKGRYFKTVDRFFRI